MKNTILIDELSSKYPYNTLLSSFGVQNELNNKALLVQSQNRFNFSKELNNKYIRNNQLSVVDSIFDAIEQVEDQKFDQIIIDYSLAESNTINFLRYINEVTPNNTKAKIVVLTDSFNHISEKDRMLLLCYSDKVISKTATYFDIKSLVIG